MYTSTLDNRSSPQTDQFTAQQMIDALVKAKGMTTIAAKYLGCDYKTVKRYIDKYPTVAAAKNAAHEQMADTVELTLI